MISLSSSKVASPRRATLSVMMKANDQRSIRRDSSLECTLPAVQGGGRQRWGGGEVQRPAHTQDAALPPDEDIYRSRSRYSKPHTCH